MNQYTIDQLNQIARQLMRSGWEYIEDRFYSVSDNRRMGWWIAGEYADKSTLSATAPTRPAGDSKPYYYATEVTARLYTEIA